MHQRKRLYTNGLLFFTKQRYFYTSENGWCCYLLLFCYRKYILVCSPPVKIKF